MGCSEITACTGRVLWITVNAMGTTDAVHAVIDQAGDIDFSGVSPEPMSHDDIDEIMLANIPKDPQVPGGFGVRLLRVAYHTDSGSEVNSSYHIEEISAPGPFHQRPTVASEHPDMTGFMRAQQSQDGLLVDTADVRGDGARAGGPRL